MDNEDVDAKYAVKALSVLGIELDAVDTPMFEDLCKCFGAYWTEMLLITFPFSEEQKERLLDK